MKHTLSAGNEQPQIDDDWLAGAAPNPYAEKLSAREEADINAIMAKLEALPAHEDNSLLGNLTPPEERLENTEKLIAGQQLRGTSEAPISDTPYSVRTSTPTPSSLPSNTPSADQSNARETEGFSLCRSSSPTPVPVDPILAIIKEARARYPASPSHTGFPDLNDRLASSSSLTSIRRTDPAFKDLAHHERIAEFHEALDDLGRTQAFTVNLSPEVELIARREAAQGRSPLVWLHKRLAHHLKLSGLPCAFFMIPEEAPVKPKHHAEREALGLPSNARLHVHGELVCPAAQREALEAALARAGGKVAESFKLHQVDAQVDPDAGWVRYLSKDTWQRLLPSDPLGKPFSVTENVRALAEERYELARSFYNGLRKAK